MTEQQRRLWLWLATASESLTWEQLDQLIAWHGGVEGIWDAVADGTCLAVGATLDSLRANHSESLLDKIERQMLDSGTRLITREDSDYPPLLFPIDCPPIALFVRGAADLAYPRQVAIIGSRRCTRYGMQMAERIARELAQAGVQVVSGMARGIDTAANMGCVAAGRPSVAVLGCGTDVVYPPENAREIGKLLDAGGALVSEYRPGTPPLQHHFPQRNRIISGLCTALLVVEAAERSGAMITVRYALEQGREVFAVPGQVGAPTSQMPLQLLREGAQMATCGQDILDWLKWQAEGFQARPQPGQTAPQSGLTDDEARIAACLADEAKSFEQLLGETGFFPAALNSYLTMLEIHEIIRQLPGRMYELMR